MGLFTATSMRLITYSTYLHDIKKNVWPLFKVLAVPLFILALASQGFVLLSVWDGLSPRMLISLSMGATLIKLFYLSFLLGITYTVMRGERVHFYSLSKSIIDKMVKSPLLIVLTLLPLCIALIYELNKDALMLSSQALQLIGIMVFVLSFMSSFAQLAIIFWADTDAQNVNLRELLYYFTKTFFDYLKLLMPVVVAIMSISFIIAAVAHSATWRCITMTGGFAESVTHASFVQAALVVLAILVALIGLAVWCAMYICAARVYLHYRSQHPVVR